MPGNGNGYPGKFPVQFFKKLIEQSRYIGMMSLIFAVDDLVVIQQNKFYGGGSNIQTKLIILTH